MSNDASKTADCQPGEPPSNVSISCCLEYGFKETLELPLDSWLFFHACPSCSKTISPTPGDCCVFCNWGFVKYPPKQAEVCYRNACSKNDQIFP